MRTSTVILLLVVCVLGAQASTSALTAADRTRLISKLQSEQRANGSFSSAAVAAASVRGLSVLKSQVKNTAGACNYVKNHAQPNDAAVLRALATVNSALNCGATLSSSASTFLNAQVASPTDATSFLNAASALKGFGASTDSAALASRAIKVMDGDEGAAGYAAAFAVLGSIGGSLADKKSLKTASDSVEDCIAIALETTTSLQFEGPIEVTVNILEGAFNLAELLNKETAFTGEQLLKLSSFLLQSRFSDSSVDVAYALVGLQVLSTNKFQVPVLINPLQTTLQHESQDKLIVTATTPLGDAVETTVTLTSAEDSDGNTVVSNKPFRATGQPGEFAFDFLASKPAAAVYTVQVSSEAKADKFINPETVTFNAKVTVAIAVVNAELSTVDSISGAATKGVRVEYPNTVKDIKADTAQKISLKFGLREKTSRKASSPHQVFVKFTNAENKEIFFVAEGNNGDYTLSVDLAEHADNFGHVSGIYTVNVLIGGSVIASSFNWHIATVHLTFPAQPRHNVENLYTARPEIQHEFRVPDSRPSSLVSTVFTVFVLAPLVLLIVAWGGLGVNLSGLNLSLSAIIFHLGVAGLLLTLVAFWVSLNMFQALGLLAVVGFVTFIAGNRVLSDRHARRNV